MDPGAIRRWSTAVVAALGGAALLFDAVRGIVVPGGFGIGQPQVWALVGLLPIYLAGVTLSLLRPAERVPRLLLVTAAAMAAATALGAALTRRYAADPGLGWLWVLAYLEHHLDLAGPAALGAVFMLFPDGRSTRRYERRVLVGYAAAALVVPPLMLVSHASLVTPVYAALPGGALGSPAYWPALRWLAAPSEVVFFAGAAMGIAGALLLAVRYRRLPPVQRTQTFWLLLAALAVGGDIALVQYLGAFGLLSHAAQVTGFYAAWVPALVTIPTAVVVALVRHRLFDVRLAVGRSLVFGALSVLIGALYLGAAAGLGLAVGDRVPLLGGVAATVAGVVAFAPARRWLVRRADRWAYGERVSGYALLAGFGGTLEGAYDLAELAPRLAENVARGLGLRWTRIALCLPEGGLTEQIGATGIGLDESAQPALCIPLVDAGADVGRIECGPARHRELGDADIELLTTLARQVCLAVRNARLSAELASQLAEIRRQAAALDASRQRLVAAQDAERRRIERDIHDGVQQQIVALTAQLRLARNQLRRDPTVAESTLAQAQTEAAQSLRDLRELAHGIHPTLLSDGGIVEAVESRAVRLPLRARVVCAPSLRSLRYAEEVEAAAYFLVCEALANVLKHAQASKVTIALTDAPDVLAVEVSDDGVGFIPAQSTGSGLIGLADRAEAVGGTFAVHSLPGGGTRVVARLPARGRRVAGV